MKEWDWTPLVMHEDQGVLLYYITMNHKIETKKKKKPLEIRDIMKTCIYKYFYTLKKIDDQT